MSAIRHTIGIDISTQTITAMLIGVVETNASPAELVISGAWMESRPCKDEISRKNPAVWVELVRECIAGLKRSARETELVEAIGISTTFPGCFAVQADGSIDPRLVSLYDNTDDAGLCSGGFDEALGRAERETLNRLWPGSMAIGLVHLVKSACLRLDGISGLVPPNTAFAHQLLADAGHRSSPESLFSDFTQTAISGLYDARTCRPVPPAVAQLLREAAPEMDTDRLSDVLPRAEPAWRNVVPPEGIASARNLLGLPSLASISIGAGDSSLGTLALMGDRQTVINVRGSSDSPTILVDAPMPCPGPRETVLQFPLPTAASPADSPWCVVAPMLRSGRVWDWVRSLRFAEDDADADEKLEALALEAFHVKTDGDGLRFDTALGGERAPLWDAQAKGSIVGLIESHGVGHIALAALEGMSAVLSECIRLMEARYGVRTDKLLLAGGPARNKLWNAITQAGTGKQTFATTFSDASLLGAALLGYGALYDGAEADRNVSGRILALSRLSSSHPLFRADSSGTVGLVNSSYNYTDRFRLPEE